MAELKPCPFCGKTPKIEDCGDYRYFVTCNCGIEQSKLYVQKCDAIKHWNRRKTEPTWEEVKEYCNKRCLDIVDSALRKMYYKQTEPRKTTDYCDDCNHKGCANCVADSRDDYCIPSNYQKQTEPQSEVVNDSQDLVKDLVKAFCEDGTWLERQGVYTLTLAEAKQRAVDIIESVTAKTEPQTDCPWK